jgi:hypothetical protein
VINTPMPLHQLSSLTIGVPDVSSTSAFYDAFGLASLGHGRFATRDGGEQLRLTPSPYLYVPKQWQGKEYLYSHGPAVPREFLAPSDAEAIFAAQAAA